MKRPGAAGMAVLTMALGIGATTTLLSLAYGTLLRPLPWPDAGRLIRVSETREGSTRELPGEFLTNATYFAWRDDPATITSLGAWRGNRLRFDGPLGGETIQAADATAGTFVALRVRPELGTAFTERDELADGPRVVLISHGLWTRAFGGDPDVVGRTIDLDEDAYQVLGVMPEGFDFPTPEFDAWRPLHVTPVESPGANGQSVALLQGLARLAPGATPADAAAEAEARAANGVRLGMVGVAVFGSDGRTIVKAETYLEALTGSLQAPMTVLLIGVGLLLVTAVGSVAGVQLAQVTSRRREFALRAALGAGSGRVGRQLVLESAVPSLAGGGAGLLLSWWLHGLLPALLPARFPRLDAVQLDLGIVVAAVLLSVLASIATAALPARQARRIDLVGSLAEDGQAPVGGSLRTSVSRTRAIILAGQVAVASLLLFSALIFGRSFAELMRADRGFQPASVLTAGLPMPSRFFTSQDRAAIVSRILERLRAVPGVTAAAATSVLPFTGVEALRSFSLPAPDLPGGTRNVQTAVRWVAPDYLAAMGMRLIEGRDFGAVPSSGRDEIIVNESFANAYLTDQRVGAILPAGWTPDRDESEVIGIAANVREDADDQPTPAVFVSYRQHPNGLTSSQPFVVVRTTGDPEALAATLRSIADQEAPTLLVDSVMTMDARLVQSLTRPRLYAVAVGGYALFAVTVAGVGLFGLLSGTVMARRREIGIRAALGATPRSIVTLVVRQGLGISAAGVLVGLLAAVGVSRFLASFIYGVSPTDVVSLLVVGVVLFGITALACFLPARRAARIDPLRALKGW